MGMEPLMELSDPEALRHGPLLASLLVRSSVSSYSPAIVEAVTTSHTLGWGPTQIEGINLLQRNGLRGCRERSA